MPSKFQNSVPDPRKNLEKIAITPKYSLGESGVNFREILNVSPRFAFDYLSLEESHLCVNNTRLSKKDLIGFIEGLKKVSEISYKTLKHNSSWRFHRIDLTDSKVSLNQNDFLLALAPSGRGISTDELPSLYQFTIRYDAKARVVGFLYIGVFYVIWYDRNHLIYPKK